MAEHNKPHWSNWHITVNANQHETSDEQRLETARVLADAVEDAIKMPELLWRWLKHFRNGRKHTFTAEQAQYVTRIRARVALEEGPNARNRSIHCHILLEVEHTTRVQLDQHELLDVLEQLTGWRGLNIKARFVKGEGSDKEYLLRYLQKDGVPRRRAADPDNARIQASRDVLDIEEYT